MLQADGFHSAAPSDVSGGGWQDGQDGEASVGGGGGTQYHSQGWLGLLIGLHRGGCQILRSGVQKGVTPKWLICRRGDHEIKNMMMITTREKGHKGLYRSGLQRVILYILFW